MRFCEDEEHENFIWVNRGIDAKVDHFKPCEVCEAILDVQDLEDRIWRDLALCNPCNTTLEIESGVFEVREERPYNLYREVQTISGNDVFFDHLN